MAKPAPKDLFTDPSTRVVWAAILELDEGDQHEVLEHLRERLVEADIRESPSARRVARAVAALREAAQELGHSPSVSDYRRLRVDHPEWPPDGSVRTWLGGTWNQALGRARLDAVKVGDSLRFDNRHFTRTEMITAIKQAAADLSEEADREVVPSLTTYLSWARRPDVRRRDGRRPRSQTPFDREFGGYRGALAAAGLVGEGARAGGSGYRYSDEELFRALDEIVDRLDSDDDHHGCFPTVGEYQRVREEILDEEAVDDRPPRPFPGQGVLQRRWRHWRTVEWHYRKARDP